MSPGRRHAAMMHDLKLDAQWFDAVASRQERHVVTVSW
jgi:hypothetical protein